MKKVNTFIFHIIAMSPVGNGLSGGDRIFIELARNFSRNKNPVKIVTWLDGINMCKRQNLVSKKDCEFYEISMGIWQKLGFFVCYLARIMKGIDWAVKYTINKDGKKHIIYSASDFWMDAMPAFILKIKNPQIIWIGTYYLAAPNPFIGFKEKGKWHIPSIKAIVYWLQQGVIYLLLKWKADIIFVTSIPDIKRFPVHMKHKKYFIVKGGVDLPKIEIWKQKLGNLPKMYDGVFMARFHTQKGVTELVDIWKKVVQIRPNAKLAMIGDGPLMSVVKEKIDELNLSKNILLFGYQFDGEEKYRIFLQSKIFLHPAIYDSGGMSAAEGMVWGLPGVSFDLEALKTYYPKGFIKIKIGNIDEFAKSIILLLTDKKLYEQKKKDAIDLIKSEWDWSKRCDQIQKYLSEQI